MKFLKHPPEIRHLPKDEIQVDREIRSEKRLLQQKLLNGIKVLKNRDELFEYAVKNKLKTKEQEESYNPQAM